MPQSAASPLCEPQSDVRLHPGIPRAEAGALRAEKGKASRLPVDGWCYNHARTRSAARPHVCTAGCRSCRRHLFHL